MKPSNPRHATFDITDDKGKIIRMSAEVLRVNEAAVVVKIGDREIRRHKIKHNVVDENGEGLGDG